MSLRKGKMMLIDIHTHACAHDPSIKEVEVLDPRIPPELLLPRTPFCYGIHPWYVEEVDFDSFKQSLSRFLHNPLFFALGEMGLDRTHKQTWDLQLEVFKKQLELAKRLKIPRLIIHSVKSEFDLLPLLKDLSYRPWILFHAYNSNFETAQALKKDLNCSFSFGHLLFAENSKSAKTLKKLDLKDVFLETDDQLKYSIKDIYAHVAKLKDCSVSEVEQQLAANYARLIS